MSNLIKHINTVAWRMLITDCILLSEGDIDNFPEWRVYFKSIDANDVGFEEKAIGYYLQDYVGHTYETSAFSINYIDVLDIFRTNICPTILCEAVYYKSVFSGRAPVLAPIFRNYLDKVALEYSKSIELDILWNNDPNAIRVPFENSIEPKLPVDYPIHTYDELYFNDYGDKPKCKLFQQDIDGNLLERSEKQYEVYSNGKILYITFGSVDEMSGLIEISK